jgi:hypothetical protein
MKRNPDLEAAREVLSSAGIRDLSYSVGGRHAQVRWLSPSGQPRMYTVPLTSSDWRSPLNVKSDIRKLLRADGLLPDQTIRTAPPARQPSKLELLEQRVALLERAIRELTNSNGPTASVGDNRKGSNGVTHTPRTST